MWVFIYFLIGILCAIITFRIFIYNEGNIELTLKDIMMLLVSIVLWPAVLAIGIIYVIDEYSDTPIISIKKKKKEE